MALVNSSDGLILINDAKIADYVAAGLHVHLYQNNYTPDETSVLGDFTEATFTGYAVGNLPGTWSSSTYSGGVATAFSSTATLYTLTAGTQTIYGYYVTDAGDATLYFSERFASPVVLVIPTNVLGLTFVISEGNPASTSVLLSDDFTDADGTALTAHTMVIGPGWASTVGDWEINSNTAQQLDTGGVEGMVHSDAGAPDVTVSLAFTLPGSGSYEVGIVARYVDDNNTWLVNVANGHGIRIIEKNAGGYTVRDEGTTVPAGTAGNLVVVLLGNSISATFDAYSASYGSATFQNTATDFGVEEYRSGSYQLVSVDDFTVEG